MREFLLLILILVGLGLADEIAENRRQIEEVQRTLVEINERLDSLTVTVQRIAAHHNQLNVLYAEHMLGHGQRIELLPLDNTLVD